MKDDSRHRARQASCRCWCRCRPSGPTPMPCPTGMHVVPGSIVRVPLGPREVVGVVWDGDAEATSIRRSCGRSPQVFDCPPIDARDAPLRRLGRRLYAVAARHGGAHGAARAGGLRSGAAGSRGCGAPGMQPDRHDGRARPRAGARRRRAGLDALGPCPRGRRLVDRRRRAEGAGRVRDGHDPAARRSSPLPDPAYAQPDLSPDQQAAADDLARRRSSRAASASR